MKIVLATGIYPPDIGGPATYVAMLGQKLVDRGLRVVIIAYGEKDSISTQIPVIRVSRRGGMILRWLRYAKALRTHAKDADVVYAFSSISCGVPLWIAHLNHPRSVLRLGGDFLWERYTDRGGTLSLSEWNASQPRGQGAMNGLLKTFDHIVFSSAFQEQLYEKVYHTLPFHHVIENAVPDNIPVLHQKHDPFKLLYLGRFVDFKNLGSLIIAMHELSGMTLTIVGEGPLEKQLKELVASEKLTDRITFLPAQSGDSKQDVFLQHDLLVLPSFTEISPNAALEARSLGLPVLLTQETGLSHMLADAAQIRVLRSPRDIVNGVRDIEQSYPLIAERSASALPTRSWDTVADEHIALFRSLV